jgi:glycosyltransferase involved in cell wall biosynthesis
VQLAELINRTPADRYEVDLLVLGPDSEFSRQWLKRDDVEVTIMEHWPRMVRSVLEIRHRCRERQYDLEHTRLFKANIEGAAGARLAGTPHVIGSVRNLSVWKRQWYRKWWFRLADALGSFAADIVTVNACALVRDHAQWACMPESKIEVVHNGLDPAHFVADRRDSRRRLIELTGAPANAVLVGTVGRLAHEKDQVTFLRLLALVRRSRCDVHGIVVGDGELRLHLEAVARSLGLSAHVTFLGERSDARRLMAGFDLFVLTSRSEGFPNVLLEATFLGVPCLATDIAGNPDVLEFKESLFAPGDIWSGAARVLELLDAPSEAAERADRARERAIKMFTAERTASTWFGLYDRCLTEETV